METACAARFFCVVFGVRRLESAGFAPAGRAAGAIVSEIAGAIQWKSTDVSRRPGGSEFVRCSKACGVRTSIAPNPRLPDAQTGDGRHEEQHGTAWEALEFHGAIP